MLHMLHFWDVLPELDPDGSEVEEDRCRRQPFGRPDVITTIPGFQ